MYYMWYPKRNIVFHFIKVFPFARLVGVFGGVLDAVFLKLLDAPISWRNNLFFFYGGLPFFLY